MNGKIIQFGIGAWGEVYLLVENKGKRKLYVGELHHTTDSDKKEIINLIEIECHNQAPQGKC